MKRVCIIGHFAKNKNLLNGQTVKTKIITKEIIKKFGKEEVSCIDTHGNIRIIVKVPGQCISALKNHRNVLIFPAENGLRVYAPMLVIMNTLFKRKLHYVVIGGWLPDFLNNKKILSFFLKKFNVLYVETNSMKKSLEKNGFDNVLVIPNCKELTILQKSELIMNTSEPHRLCTFSRVMKEKGIEDAVNAVKMINNLENRNVFSLDIYGQIEPTQKEWFDDLIKKFPEYISYRGMVPFDKSTEVLKNYYALLFPTYYEGEGVAGTLIDAMAAGVPVIASDWKYNNEVIETAVNGILYDGNLVESLLIAIDNPENWLLMKEKCLTKADLYLPKNSLVPLIKILEKS